MKKIILSLCVYVMTLTATSQNVGIGQNTPKAKLDINGNLIIGTTYSGSGTVTVPANGAIIQGNVGIGNSNPGALLDLGLAGTTAGVLRLAGSTSGNVTIQTQAAAGSYILQLPATIGSPNQVLANSGTAGTLTWTTPTAGTVTGVTANSGTSLGSASTAAAPVVQLGATTLSTSASPLLQATYINQNGNALSIGNDAANNALTLGSTSGTSATSVNCGTGGVTINTANATTQAVTVNTNFVTTSTGMGVSANSLTTGTGLSIASTGVTAGKLLNIASTSAAGTANTSTYMANISSSGVNAGATHTTYGVASTVTNTGTTNTNIAGYFSASGATTGNYGIIVPSGGGSVGIGMSAPSAPLHVFSANATGVALDAATGGQAYMLYDGGSATTAGTLQAAVALAGTATNSWTNGATQNDLVIRTNNTSGTQKILFNTNGGSATTMSIYGANVGIGTITPSNLLTVMAPSTSPSASALGVIKMANASAVAGDEVWMGFDDGTLTSDANDRARIGCDILSGGKGRIFFTTGAAGSQTQRMVIDESGNVGIGVSLTAGSASTVAGNLHVYTTTAGTTGGKNGPLVVENLASGGSSDGSVRGIYLSATGYSSSAIDIAAETFNGHTNIPAAIRFVDNNNGTDIAFRVALTGSSHPTPNTGAETEVMRVSSTYGTVGIGGAPTGNAELEINSSAAPNSGSSSYAYYAKTTSGYAGSGMTTYTNYSIYTSGKIWCGGELDVTSDERTKHVLDTSKSERDLESINKLNVVDYQYIDEVAKGATKVKGFLAQQVETVFPDAVNKQTGFIPDIYRNAEDVCYDASTQKLTIYLNASHGLVKGDKVQLKTEGGDKTVIVACVTDEKTFVVENWEKDIDKVFVYGKEVTDLRNLDYNKIFSAGISATQELSKKLDEAQTRVAKLEAENAQLKSVTTEQSEMMKTMKAQLDEVRDRLNMTTNK